MKTQAELAAEQVAFWNGPGGKLWLEAYELTRRAVAPFSEAVLAAASVKAGENVADIGCGTGETTAVLAKAVGPSGHVLGIDVSEPLIAAARAQNLGNATFVLGDASSHPFEAHRLDLLFSRFGVMFFGDAEAAFKNMRRALKPTGRLVFICWRTLKENPWGLVPFQAAAPHLPPVERPGPEDPGQYAFGERARVERILGVAGFVQPAFRQVDHLIVLGKDAATATENVTRRGPLGRAMAGATPEQAEAARRSVLAALAAHEGPQGVALKGACWLVTARAT